MLILTLILAIVVGILLRRSVWIGIGLVGVAAGYTLGFTIYATLLVTCGWTSRWGLWTLQILCAVAGGALTFKYGQQIVIFGTSLIGSYMVMRGLTLVFAEDYPSESDIYAKIEAGEDPGLDWHFWLYLGVFIVTTVCTSYW